MSIEQNHINPNLHVGFLSEVTDINHVNLFASLISHDRNITHNDVDGNDLACI